MNASRKPPVKSEFLDSVQKGMLLGVALLALLLPPAGLMQRGAPSPASSPARISPLPQGPSAPQVPPPQVASPEAEAPPPRLADFGSFTPTPEVRHVANWTVYTRDHQNKAIIIVDKKDARIYVFDRAGKLRTTAPALLGSAIGDHTVPGIGDRPIAQVRPDERTTPAGRFIAEMGMNTRGEDVVWVDYDSAVSMHRVLTTNPKERRLQRLTTPTVEDNRISYGCINVPRDFYETVLSPVVRTTGAIIYVLPDTGTVQQVFGSYDVEAALKVARR
jgi:hypothetical protein